MGNPNKKYNYRHEKSDKEREIRSVKRKTRLKYPLRGFSYLKARRCYFCPEQATLHHHTTIPIEFDKFEFMCKKCHTKLHRLLRKLGVGVNKK